jgi:uncharacterized paraquat-inducible protein A
VDGRSKEQWRCRKCHKAVCLNPELGDQDDLTACPRCLAELRFLTDRFHKFKASGVTTLIRKNPVVAIELLRLIEQYNQAKLQQ